MVENSVFHFLDVAATNAYVIHNQLSPSGTHKRFQMALVRELLQKSEMQQNPNPSPGRPFRSSVRAVHCPVPVTMKYLDDKSSKSTKGRRNCKLCTILLKKEQRTKWKCSVCDLPLCLQLDRNCFQRWHTTDCDIYRA